MVEQARKVGFRGADKEMCVCVVYMTVCVCVCTCNLVAPRVWSQSYVYL